MSGSNEIERRYLEELRQAREAQTAEELRRKLTDYGFKDLPRLLSMIMSPPEPIDPGPGGAARIWMWSATQPEPRPIGRLISAELTVDETTIPLRIDETMPPDTIRFERRAFRGELSGAGELTEEGWRVFDEALQASLERMQQEAKRQFLRGLMEPAEPVRFNPDTIPYEPETRYVSSVFGFGGPVVMEPRAYVSPTFGLADPPARRVPGRAIYEAYDVPLPRGGRRRHRRERKKRRRG